MRNFRAKKLEAGSVNRNQAASVAATRDPVTESPEIPAAPATTDLEPESAAATVQEAAAGINLFPCDVCGLHFRTKRGLTSHKRVHRVPVPELEREPADDTIASLETSVLEQQRDGEDSLDSREGTKPKGGVALEEPEILDKSGQQSPETLRESARREEVCISPVREGLTHRASSTPDISSGLRDWYEDGASDDTSSDGDDSDSESGHETQVQVHAPAQTYDMTNEDVCVDCGGDFQGAEEGKRCQLCDHCWHTVCQDPDETPAGTGISLTPWECERCDGGRGLKWCCCGTRGKTCGESRPAWQREL